MKKIIIMLMLVISYVSFGVTIRTLKVGYVVTRTEEQLEKVVDFAISGDNEAFAKYVTILSESGQGGMITEPNVEVYITKTSWNETAQFRVKGDTTTYWTISQAFTE